MFSKALIIDDDPASRKLARYFLEKMGCGIREAGDGEIGALNLLNEEQEVLILDWRMPKLNGRETLLIMDSLLRQMTVTKSFFPLPTIVYTSVTFDDLDLPRTKFFDIKGYVHKNWSVEVQGRCFRKIIRELRKGNQHE